MQIKVPSEPKLIRELNSVISRLKIHTYDFKKPIGSVIEMPPLKKETQRLAIDYLEEFELIKIRKRPKSRKGVYVFTILNNAKL